MVEYSVASFAIAKVMRVVYILSIFLGAVGGIQFLYQFLDILLASIIIPNMIGLVLMRKEIKELKDEFFSNKKYYPGAKGTSEEEQIS